MITKRLGKRILVVTGYLLGGLAILFVAFHFWFINHAKQLVEETVDRKSNGQLHLKINKLSYNYFSSRMTIKDAVFLTTDTATAASAYKFLVKEIRLDLKALLPLILKKKLLIDSLYFQSPTIQVTTFRDTKDTVKKNQKDISIPYEMGKVYNSIQNALQVLQVNRFEIEDGQFVLINKVQPDQLPLQINNIHFHIDNLQVDTGKLTGKEKILFSDNVVLRSSNQNIIFPDGRHRLSFSKFRINLKKRIVEFDSCTIAATRTDTSESAFNVFFDALRLTNIDFDTLYRSEVIKADSVYCVNPKFNLYVPADKRKKDNKKPPPKLENIIKQLTGDLLLGYVVVSNADFNIITTKEGKPSTFTFSNNNFEMQGLSIDQEAQKPLKVKSFAMAIRNYENFIKDSTYSVQFDSIMFKDDRITLSNFLFNKLDDGKILNTFSIPQFKLRGLSWDDLVFERKLRAEQATMYNPYISYTASAKQNKGKEKKTMFQSLGAINDYMDLQQLDIVNGTIDLKLKNNLRVQLENATTSIKSHSLLESKKLLGIKNSVTELKFFKGTIHTPTLDMELNNIFYIGQSGQFVAGSIKVSTRKKSMTIALQDVNVQKMQVDEVSGNIYAEGVKWQKADIKINADNGTKGSGKSSIELNDVQGSNTSISGMFSGKAVSTKLNSISFNQLIKKGKSNIKLDGLYVNGKQLKVKDNNLNLSIADYEITDNKSSSFRQIIYKARNGNMTADIAIPSLTITPHITPLLNGDISLDGVGLLKPVINLQLTKKNAPDSGKKTGAPKIVLNELRLTQPKINFTQVSDSGTLSLNWNGEQNKANFLLVNGLQTSPSVTSLSNLKFYLTDFIFTNPKGKTFTTGEGKVAAQLKDISIEQKPNETPEWKAFVSVFDARDFKLDSIGKSKGNLVMNSGSVNNLNISSSNITSLQKMAAANSAFQINHLTGSFSDVSKNLLWYNANLNRQNNTFTLDSFSFSPSLGLDSFLAQQVFQKDYMKFKTGAIRIGPVDIDRLVKENKLKIATATIDNFVFTDYKDKRLPFNPGIVKPLPVNLIKRIPQLLSIDSLMFNNATVEYTETGEKTKEPGTIPVTRMSIRILNAKNYNISPTDSLSIRATGYVMDTAWMNVRVKESYTDSLGGFLMTFRMKPADLTAFNTALVPLASVKLESGFLDTLTMRAVGREYLSLGEMKMYYHDLKVRFLKSGDEKKKSFLTGLMSFIANNFVVKKNNTSRIGQVFFIRQRDRSAINYLIKIAMSGMASSVGAKSNKKMLRKYKKELIERNLPTIDFE